jgi:ribonuclease HI
MMERVTVSTMITVASDGSCLKNPGGAIGWAWADNQGRWMRNGFPVGTNNSAELLGFASILASFTKRDLHVQLDSKYTLDMADKWIWGWAKRGWKKKDGEIKNLDIVLLIHALLIQRRERGLTTDFEWVKGHQSKTPDSLNNIVDRLAGESSAAARDGGGLYLDFRGRTASEKQDKLLTLAKVRH